MPSYRMSCGGFRRVIPVERSGCLACIATLALFVSASLPARGAEPLKFLISIEQQRIEAPLPAHFFLHLHNDGHETVWLYRHARSKVPGPRPRLEDDNTPRTTGSSALDVKLEPASAGGAAVSKPAGGMAFEPAGLPTPKLVRLAPGEDYEEKATIRLTPAFSGEQKPLWGTYRLALVYKAQYSNAQDLQRNLKLTAWEGEVTSNTIEVQLQPPNREADGQISGKAATSASVLLRDATVTLADGNQHLIDQTTSDSDGRYSFSGLPLGLYWVTARRDGATEDTAVFRHVEVTASQPSVTQDLVMVPPEVFQARKMLHKPVLFMVTDVTGRPLDGVGLEATWSNGTVVDSVKGETGEDGSVALELIPGRSYVTLKRRHCKKQDERADVANGEGIDGFSYTMDCTSK